MTLPKVAVQVFTSLQEEHIQAWMNLMAQQGSVQITAGQSNRSTAVFTAQILAGPENEVKGNVEMLR